MIAEYGRRGVAIMGKYSRTVAHRAKQNLLLGSICCNCGTECGKDIEYHHIVPLERGGRDVLSNLAPVCYDCHTKIHFDFERKKPERRGRKPKTYDQDLMNNVFGRYVNKELSEKDARAELGTGCRIKDMVQFKEWAERNGIDIRKSFGQSGRWYK